MDRGSRRIQSSNSPPSFFTLNYSPSSSASPGVDAGFRGTQWFS
jgi:hypothetical protein